LRRKRWVVFLKIKGDPRHVIVSARSEEEAILKCSRGKDDFKKCIVKALPAGIACKDYLKTHYAPVEKALEKAKKKRALVNKLFKFFGPLIYLKRKILGVFR